jgi:MFS family permease
LLTASGFLVIWAKLSSLIGIKLTLVVSILLFMAFSAGCGASQTIEQLQGPPISFEQFRPNSLAFTSIIFRTFQAISGSGLYFLPNISFFQLVPPAEYNRVNTIASVSMALALILSPLIGGAISQSGDWRWIFYYNLPLELWLSLYLYRYCPANSQI